MAIASHDAEERTASSTATAISIEAVDKTFRLPHQQYSTLKERLLHPRGGQQPRSPPRAARRLLRRQAGRVLRHRRPQRQRQEHAAQVPGRHLPAEQRQHQDRRARVAVHRAGRGLQPGDGRARQHHPERRDAGPDAARGARARRRGHRLRRARGLRGPQAQELLVGHAGAAGLRRDGPGGRRRAAHRRDPGRGRRRLPAEVLRRVLPPARRGQDDRAGHARHGRRRPLLPPRRAARGGPRGGAGRPVRGGRPLHGHELRARHRRRPGRVRRRARRRRRGARAGGVGRGRERRPLRHRAPGHAVRVQGARALQRGAARSRVLGGLRQLRAARTCSWPRTCCGDFARRRRGGGRRDLPQRAGARAATRCPRCSRAAAAATPRWTGWSTSRTSWSPARGPAAAWWTWRTTCRSSGWTRERAPRDRRRCARSAGRPPSAPAR